MDSAGLASLATIEFAPPDELTAAQGGVLLAESVRKEHKVAWLIGAAIDGHADVEERRPEQGRAGAPVERPGPAPAAARPDLRRPRPGGAGTHDPAFAAGWDEVGNELLVWQRGSGLWDPAGDRRRLMAMVLGAVAGLVGLGLVAGGAAAANRWGAAVPGGGGGGRPAGRRGPGGAGALVELRVRTPAGSGLWLRVESFRRFLAGSEAHHADEAAKRGVLREYTAWAVAVGEIDRWSRAVAASSVAADPTATRYAYLAPSLASAAAASAVKPSSSGSGGGGGGVGGGAGGVAAVLVS